LPAQHDHRVLIDYRTSDDAGVYQWDERRALVQTVDFFTPIVDDPFAYGQIAAANSLSDVYAMGGRPLTALAIAGFPKDGDRTVLRQIFAGGLEKLREAGVALLGGHTVQDNEIKFGYAITGEVDPGALWSNAGARPGDMLILTKPLGTGIIATALKFGRAPATSIDAAIRSMLKLNGPAAEALRTLKAGTVHACTDITGFGLIGHGSEVAAASNCTLEIDTARVPLLPDVMGLVERNVPGGGRTNAAYFGGGVRFAAEVDAVLLQVMHDPQTSGGLLAVVDLAHADAAEEAMKARGVEAARIGTVVPAEGVRLILR
jgi:selenide,water dikinase